MTFILLKEPPHIPHIQIKPKAVGNPIPPPAVSGLQASGFKSQMSQGWPCSLPSPQWQPRPAHPQHMLAPITGLSGLFPKSLSGFQNNLTPPTSPMSPQQPILYLTENNILLQSGVLIVSHTLKNPP